MPADPERSIPERCEICWRFRHLRPLLGEGGGE
jgi:hypothetical protein